MQEQRKLGSRTIVFLILVLGLSLLLGGCALVADFGSNLRQQWAGLPLTLATYDDQAQKIDQVRGTSLAITRDRQFDEINSDGKQNKQSKVMKITVGSHLMRHVGSSLIAYQDGLTNVLDQHPQKVQAINKKRNVPFVNRFVHAVKDDFSGSSYVILIRSQTGQPIATFAGNRVRVSKTDVPSSTNLLIDGKRLFVYRCDYTIYEKAMLD
ncbi:DUF5052 family protein [Lactobacillus sp. DCY120]|uniref:DUF5052 family protein n=1 Tax=Bombilactobacillus apium TaxID=2675299 RepID=A0A850QVV5_9LACO|nr:DUF5052 family protein [Bombilactobacillus apium]NVY95924.1 DUF5052 family protein [Bombilactobacillus apium]